MEIQQQNSNDRNTRISPKHRIRDREKNTYILIKLLLNIHKHLQTNPSTINPPHINIASL